MTYPTPAETILTAREARLLRRLMAILTADQLEQFVMAMEEIAANGQGLVTIKIYRGLARFVERTFTDDLRE